MKYKKPIMILVAIFFLLYISACSSTKPPEKHGPPISDTINTEIIAEDEPNVDLPTNDAVEGTNPPFEGKIVIITDDPSNSYSYFSAYPLIEKYGKDKVIHLMWPVNFPNEPEEVINKYLLELSADSEIKAIIIKQPAFFNAIVALEKLHVVRKDIYVICLASSFSFDDINGYLQTADFVLLTDKLNIGSAITEKAKKLGSETLVYYYFTPYTSDQFHAKKHELIKKKCTSLGIKFVDTNTLNPNATNPGNTASMIEAEQFVLVDVPKKVIEYGKNTAFYSELCFLQTQLIEAVLDTGAIYPSPCCPYPFYRYPNNDWGVMPLAEASYFSTGNTNGFVNCLDNAIAQIKSGLEGKGDLSRLSTWPVFDTFMYASTAAEYAIKWINGEVPKDGVDVEVLTQLMEEYAGVNVYLTPFVDDGTHDYYERKSEPTGETYENFLLMRMDYVTFEELGVK